MHRLRGKLTYANAVSTLALFLVLAGGTAFATQHLVPKNSVGTSQIKKEAITAAKIRTGAVTGAKIARASIDLGSLRPVPSAARAAVAAKAESAASGSFRG